MLANYISGIENKWTKALKLKVIEASIKNPWFTKENIESYISYKRENEVSPMDLRPHPHEFNLYYDV